MRVIAALCTTILSTAFAIACGQGPATTAGGAEKYDYYVQGVSPAPTAVSAFPKNGGAIYSWSASADGRRLALIVPGRQASTYTIMWITVSADGHPRLVGPLTMTTNSYVALSSSGSRAVLGGPGPVLSCFGRASGRRLPLEHVSQAWAGGARTIAMRFWTTDDRQYQRALLLDDVGRVLRRVRLSGPGCAIHADPSARYVTLGRGTSEEWRMVDVRTGRRTGLGSTYADVVPFRSGGFVAVDHHGWVVTREDGFAATR